MVRRRLIVCGFGNVGRAFARLVADKDDYLKGRYGLSLELVALVDIGGAAIAEGESLPIIEFLSHVEKGGTVETFAKIGHAGMTGVEVIARVNAHVLIEATPTNLATGEPGRAHIMAALDKGMDIVSANKGPLVLFYKEINELARARRSGIYMSAATSAALPTLDVGLTSLAGSKVLSIEGILNGTTNYILTRMHREKCSYDDALKAAQEMGIAETDPSLDVKGWDTRNKLLLIANRLFEGNFAPEDVEVTGITGITLDDIEAAKVEGNVIKLLGTAKHDDDQVMLRVGPEALSREHPLATIDYAEKAISFLTDTMGRITVSGGKSSPVGAAAALLKDLINSSSSLDSLS
jgi:homoserine dehydrogenase